MKRPRLDFQVSIPFPLISLFPGKKQTCLEESKLRFLSEQSHKELWALEQALDFSVPQFVYQIKPELKDLSSFCLKIISPSLQIAFKVLVHLYLSLISWRNYCFTSFINEMTCSCSQLGEKQDQTLGFLQLDTMLLYPKEHMKRKENQHRISL